MEKYRKEKCKRKSIEIGIYRIERERVMLLLIGKEKKIALNIYVFNFVQD